MANPAAVPTTKNTGNFTASSLTSVTVTSVGVPTRGNVMVAAMVIQGAVVDPGTITGPGAGWVSVQQDIIGAGLIARASVFTKIAGASESGSYAFGWTNLAVDGFWIFVEYRDGDSDQALDGPGLNQQNVASTNAAAPAVQPSAWNSYDTLVCVWAASLVALSVMSMGGPAGMTVQAQASSALVSFPAIMLADVPLQSSASTGAKTATVAVSTTSMGISFLIKQSPWASLAPTGAGSG